MTEAASGLDTRTSEVLYARAAGLLPGGVNSPVRAMRAIGRDHPVFVERGEIVQGSGDLGMLLPLGLLTDRKCLLIQG